MDDGVSGTTFDRPGFNRMINDVENKRINMIVTKDLSRLGRDYIKTGYYIENYFPEKNIRYVAINDNVDTYLDNNNNDITPFKAILNDMYAKDISKKIRSVFKEKQKSGEYMCSYAAYGYKKNPDKKNKLIPDENVSEITRMIFDMYKNGHGSPDILNCLTKAHILSPSGYRKTGIVQDEELSKEYHWNEGTIMAMLKNEVYIGNTVQNKTSVISYKIKKLRKVAKEKYIKVIDTHEPIIDRDTFEIVQSIVQKRGMNTKLKYEYLLRGLLICHHCGRRLQIALKSNSRKNAIKRPYINCAGHKERGCYALNMNYDKFEASILNIIKQICSLYISRNDLYEAYINYDNKIIDLKQGMKKKIESFNKSIAELDNNLEKMYMDKLRGIIPEDSYIKYSEKMIQQKELMLTQKSELENELKIENRKDETKKQLDSIINEFMKFEKIDKVFLYKILDRIEIDKDKNIYLFFNFSKLNVIGQNLNELIDVNEILENKSWKMAQ